MRGDDVLATLELRDVAVLKIDVEGGELEAIEGARDTLTRRPFVVCEILPLFSETGQKGRFRKPRQDRLLALMRDAGYALYRVLPDATAVRLEGIEIHGDLALTNYLFAPTEETGWVEKALPPH
jgi:hypothetical protein